MSLSPFLAREHQERVTDHPRALNRADVPKYDVRPAGRAFRGDVQRKGTLLGRLDRLPGRLHLRRGPCSHNHGVLLETTGTSLSISIYVFLMAAITFFSVYLITETYEGEMTQDQEQETEEEEAATAG